MKARNVIVWLAAVAGLGGALISGGAIATHAVPLAPHTSTLRISNCAAVMWTNLVNVSASGASLQKTGQNVAWDAGASSVSALTSGSGRVEVIVDSTITGRMFGLTHIETGPSYTDIGYALELQNDGTLQVFESGQYRGQVGTYAVGDVLSVAIMNGRVNYYDNSLLLYTSAVLPVYPLVADASLRDPSAKLLYAAFCGTITPVPTGTPTPRPSPTVTPTNTPTNTPLPTPTCVATSIPADTPTLTGIAATPTPSTTSVAGDLLPELGMGPLADFAISTTANGCTRLQFSTTIVNVGAGPFELHGQRPNAGEALMTVTQRIYNASSGNTLRKLGTDSNWDAGADSVATLASGNGGVQVTADSTTNGRMFGLTHIETSPSYTDINYALELQSDGTLQVYESGLFRASVGTYAVGDVLKVTIVNGAVGYYDNGTLLYTSAVTPTYPLVADASIRDPLGEIANAMFCRPACAPVNWTNLANVSASGFRDVPTNAVMYFAGDGHNHWHVRDLETYKLEPLDAGTQAAIGDKHGFCFTDNVQYQPALPGAPQSPQYIGCGHAPDLQVTVGLSVGWGDLYGVTLPDQYIDITALPPGKYRLWAIADANGYFQESNKSNNDTWIDLRWNGGQSLTILAYGPHA